MPIISTAEYKAWIGDSSSAYDTIIGIAISACQADLETLCGRQFDEATYTDEVYSGKGEPNLWLRNYPVSAVTAVKSVASDGTETTVTATDYRLVDSEYLHRISSSDFGWGYPPLGSKRYPCWNEGDGNYLVTYTGGYATAPDNLKLLMYRLVDAALDNRGENFHLSQTGDGVKQRTVLTGKAFAEHKADLIRPWVRGSV